MDRRHHYLVVFHIMMTQKFCTRATNDLRHCLQRFDILSTLANGTRKSEAVSRSKRSGLQVSRRWCCTICLQSKSNPHHPNFGSYELASNELQIQIVTIIIFQALNWMVEAAKRDREALLRHQCRSPSRIAIPKPTKDEIQHCE